MSAIAQIVFTVLAKYGLTFEPAEPVVADLEKEIAMTLQLHAVSAVATSAPTSSAPAVTPLAPAATESKGTRGAKKGAVNCYNLYLGQFQAEWVEYNKRPAVEGETKKDYTGYMAPHRESWKTLSKDPAFKKTWQDKAKLQSEQKLIATPIITIVAAPS